jgi:hypothetical protein
MPGPPRQWRHAEAGVTARYALHLGAEEKIISVHPAGHACVQHFQGNLHLLAAERPAGFEHFSYGRPVFRN